MSKVKYTGTLNCLTHTSKSGVTRRFFKDKFVEVSDTVDSLQYDELGQFEILWSVKDITMLVRELGLSEMKKIAKRWGSKDPDILVTKKQFLEEFKRIKGG